MWLGFIKAAFIAIVGILMFLLGLIIVAIALPFAKPIALTKKSFSQFPGEWELIRLPSWAIYWDNPADGALGDRRGWWDNYCKENYHKDCRDFYSKWQWLAIRNSSNYWSRITTGIDSELCEVTLVTKSKYWQLLRATCYGKVYPLFEGFIPYANKTHGFEWRIGWKIKLEPIDKDLSLAERHWGSVFRIRPWKVV